MIAASSELQNKRAEEGAATCSVVHASFQRAWRCAVPKSDLADSTHVGAVCSLYILPADAGACRSGASTTEHGATELSGAVYRPSGGWTRESEARAVRRDGVSPLPPLLPPPHCCGSVVVANGRTRIPKGCGAVFRCGMLGSAPLLAPAALLLAALAGPSPQHALKVRAPRAPAERPLPLDRLPS